MPDPYTVTTDLEPQILITDPDPRAIVNMFEITDPDTITGPEFGGSGAGYATMALAAESKVTMFN